jgi:hypothetical protein
MAFSAILEIGDNDAKRYYKRYQLTDLRVVFNRSYTVIPDGVARCERLELTVVAPGRKDLFMFEWFLRSHAITGRVVVSLTGDVNDLGSNNQEIYFEDATCFSMSENYDIDSARRRSLKLGLVSDKIDIEDLTFKCL